MYIFLQINYIILETRRLNIKEKVELIKDLIHSYDLSSYEISKNTNISIFGIDSIIKGTTKKPRKDTLDKILDYLNSLNKSINNNVELKEEYTTAFRNNLVAEEPENYPIFKDLKIDDKLDIIYQQNTDIEKTLAEITNTVSSIIIEIKKNSNKLEDIKNIK